MFASRSAALRRAAVALPRTQARTIASTSARRAEQTPLQPLDVVEVSRQPGALPDPQRKSISSSQCGSQCIRAGLSPSVVSQWLDTPSSLTSPCSDESRRVGGTTRSEGTLARLSVMLVIARKISNRYKPLTSDRIRIQLHEQEDSLSMWSPDAHPMPAGWALTQVCFSLGHALHRIVQAS